MNKILLWGVIIVIVVGGAYFFFMHQPSASPTTQNSGCLAQGEVASNGTSTTGNSIVIRNSQTNAEVSSFSLPSSTLLVENFQSCNVTVIAATDYSIDTYPAGQFESYELLPGATLDQWQYSYDGTSKKIATIIDNSGSGAHSVTLKFDPSTQYVSAVSFSEGFNIRVFSIVDGSQLFDGSKVAGGADFTLWKGDTKETSWATDASGTEVLKLNLEDSNGGAQEAIVSTKTWTVE